MEEKKARFKIKIYFGKVAAIMLAIFAVLLAADLILKACAEKYGWEFIVIKGFIEVVPLQRNSGAAFSFLADKEWAYVFFIVIAFIILIPTILFFFVLPERFVILKLALSLICAGALGNLVDRFAFHSVRDFVNVKMFGKWACCNFADFWIVFGGILAIIDVLFLNEWAVFPLTKRAKEWAKELEKGDELPIPPDEPAAPEEAQTQEEQPEEQSAPAQGDEDKSEEDGGNA